ncbi:hypothetical protein [Gracilibacillus xinjiangensis]|uniref:Uncharacterized protein n=1 Tax=Gracilibacillus xinjiangensis TaxID=1193282 RepID=A0ABV8X0T2_9BACI
MERKKIVFRFIGIVAFLVLFAVSMFFSDKYPQLIWAGIIGLAGFSCMIFKTVKLSTKHYS